MQDGKGIRKESGKSVHGSGVFRPQNWTGTARAVCTGPAGHPLRLCGRSELGRGEPAAARRNPPNLAEMQDLQENLQKLGHVVYFPRQNVNDTGHKMQDTMQKCGTPPHFTNLKGLFPWRRAIALLPPSMFPLGSHPIYHRRVNLFSTIIYFSSRQPKAICVYGRRFSYA